MGRLDLEHSSSLWLSKLDTLPPSPPMPAPDLAALGCLALSEADAADLVRTMPSAERDPELWRLLEKSRQLLSLNLAHNSRPGDAPLPPPPQSGLFPAHLIWASLDAIRTCHRQFGVPDEISRETLSYVGPAMAAYRARYGKAGIHLTAWDWLRFSGWLYRVGRLEVSVYWLRTHPKEAGPLFWYNDQTAERLGLPFRNGDFALGIHVPGTARLTPESCVVSIRRMRDAFAGARIATCTAWLLDEQLNEYLPADSNILSFQRRFRLVPGFREADEATLRAIFGDQYSPDLDRLPRRTTLERAAVEHLRRGRHWHLRTGWFEL